MRELSKSYDGKLVIDVLAFSVRPGVVTGFLGPNGAGESTTMRLIVGHDRPTSGGATIGGTRYAVSLAHSTSSALCSTPVRPTRAAPPT